VGDVRHELDEKLGIEVAMSLEFSVFVSGRDRYEAFAPGVMLMF
jgi:hypothetical protein